jgi:hypothetical protein
VAVPLDVCPTGQPEKLGYETSKIGLEHESRDLVGEFAVLSSGVVGTFSSRW